VKFVKLKGNDTRWSADLWEGIKNTKNGKYQPGMVGHTCNSSYSVGTGRKLGSLRPALAVSETLSQKQKNKNKRAGGVDQEVARLPSMCIIYKINFLSISLKYTRLF
jgi:hypothetical protein